MIRDPLIQFMLTANMEQVLRIIAEDEVIEIGFDNPERLEDIARAFTYRALMLKTADQFGFDFDETLEYFDKEQRTYYDDEITEEDVEDIIANILEGE